jgi:hypothetical protein
MSIGFTNVRQNLVDAVEKLFTDEIMTKNYLQIFERVFEDEPAFRW